jgi:hypothetical protein
MTASTLLPASVRAAFTALIDYAGLFPPAELGFDAAQREYRAARARPHAWMLGRFIVPATLAMAAPGDAGGPLSVIAKAGALDRAAALRANGAHVDALEIPLSASASPSDVAAMVDDVGAAIDAAGLGGTAAYVELPRTRAWPELLAVAMPALARARLGAKIRCGGLAAGAFPSVDDVAAFIAAAAAANVPFKATAGLHHPVRHVDRATGFTMHGFLNLLAATALAGHVDTLTLRQIVADEAPDAFRFDEGSLRWRDRRASAAELETMRRDGFVAYGSCSFAEPVDDLTSLGVLPLQ